jgi:hypothetical protein
MKFEIAIPSFKRAHILQNKTLNLLNRHGIPKHLIKIFVRDKDELASYLHTIGDSYHFVINDAKSIGEVRNHLKYYYREETNIDWVLYIDDDIDEIYQYINDKEIKVIENLEKRIMYNFMRAEEEGARLWGVGPLSNPFFMSNKETTNLKYIIGAFSGEIIDRSKEMILCDTDHGEDFQFSMEYYLRDGCVLRFNDIAIKTKYFGDGGINESYGGKANRLAACEGAMKYLEDRYGDMCKAIQKKWGWDLRLNYRYNNI